MDNLCNHMDAYKTKFTLSLVGFHSPWKNTTNIINEFAYAKYNVYIAMCLLHNA